MVPAVSLALGAPSVKGHSKVQNTNICCGLFADPFLLTEGSILDPCYKI
jgi:hypothetical protein